MKEILLVVLILFFSGMVNADHGMNQAKMEKIVMDMASDSNGKNGLVEFIVDDVKLYLISNIKHDRMRIVAPIAEYDKISRVQIDALMQANYDRALDARYAVHKGVLYSAFIHPMSELTRWQLKSAVKQVANLALSFGGDYSSGELIFGSDH